MDMTSDLVREAAEMALATLGLKGVELEDAKRFTVNYALSNTSIRQRFSTALTDEHYISKAQGHTATVSRNVPSDLGLPTLRMPTVIRQKQTRHKMKIDHRVSAQTMEFFNKHYSRLFEFNFTQLYSHDHPEAAASRKIESEEVMYMLRAEGADMLRSPVSTYDCSIIDVGGDWRYHYVRQHIGVHCDVPFLDARDITRDARKRLQLKCTTDNEHFVCRDKMQDCTITGPYMMAIHSVLYTSTILEVCESMTRRGTHYFVGTMQLPDNLETMYTSYVDPDYGYTIEYKDPDLVVAGKYLPPPMRAGLGKYMINDKRHKLVYRYPSGQSCEYIHDRAVLLEKLYDGTYYVYTKNGDKLSFEYKIVKRVGSLVYASIRLSSTEPPAHRVQMVYPVKSYVDDYVVRVDGNLLSNFSIKFARATDISVPRQLFTAVAVYCMTKVRNPAFCIEEAIAYGFSAASQIEANGVILHIGTMSADRNVVVITAAVASFFFAFDRFRLIEHRIPQLAVADTNEEVQKSMMKVFQDYVGVKPIYESLKSMFVRTAEDMAVDYLIDKGTSYGDIRKIYEQLTAITTPGISKIRDMAHCYVQLQPLHAVIKRRDAHYSGRLVDAAIFVTPTYELEPDNRVVCLRKQAAELREKYRNAADGVQLKPLSKVEDLVLEPTTSTVKSHDNFDNAQQDVNRDEYSLNASRVALDAILMVTAAEDERMQSAREIFLRVFDNNSGNLRSVECLKGTVKGKPLLAHLIEGSVVKITTLEREYHKGEEGFDTVASQLSTDRFIYPRRKEDNTFECGYAVFIDNQYMRDDDSCRVIFDTVTALHMPDLKILNSKNLLPLKSLVARGNFPPQVHSVLANECAGSGKTHDQCMRYKAAVEFGRSVAIFASTKAAAGQAKSRLEAWKVPIAPYSISTVDSYLMNTRAWETTFHEVYIDEALQLHAGKIYCIIKLASPRILRGYGDRKQIGYIPFTRFHTPSVSTEFPWSEEHTNLVTRRIPNDSTIVPWLRSEIFYGPQFKSVSHRTKAVVSYSRISAIEGQLTMSTIYGIMGISHSSELMILVYLQEEAARLRSKLGLTRTMPESEDCEYKACVCTMGEAQGEDVDNVIVMRLSTKQEPLHGDAGQTTVALTRHKQRWAYLAVTSQFPTLIEQMGGVPETHGSMSSIITSATRF